MTPFYWVAKNLYLVLFWVLRGKVENMDRLRAWKSGIIAANHISFLDPPLVGAITPHAINFLAKSELFKTPLLGLAVRNLNAIPIRRGAIDRHAMKMVVEALERGGCVLIFPEGSRKNFTARPGIGKIAIQTNSPVLPLYFENTNQPLRKRMRVVVGEPITRETISQYEDNKDGYRGLSEHILHRINALGAATLGGDSPDQLSDSASVRDAANTAENDHADTTGA